MKRTFTYILRYEIDPFFYADDRANELVEFCISASIGEVMLFFAAEELSAGHITQEELAAYVPLARNLKGMLEARGVALSLNPWTTVYHTARGRRLKPDQVFTRMVGETGAEDAIAACPLCPNWQAYLSDTFAFLAREIRPVAIWVEDDFRLHNHSPELGWGGCFCRLHVERFSRLLGRRISREEIVSEVVAAGEPHPWRKLWLDLSRETLLEPARRLREAVERAQPGVRLGLMTSAPDVHSIEGRDWKALQEAFGTEPAFLLRPHLPPYTEERALHTVPSVTRHTLANFGGPLAVYPELENSPRCGRYSKSGTFSVWECYESAALGSAGITINHFDMMGNGTSLDPGFSVYLRDAKARLDAIAELMIDDRQALPEPAAGQRDGLPPRKAPKRRPALLFHNTGARHWKTARVRKHCCLVGWLCRDNHVASQFVENAKGRQSPFSASWLTSRSIIQCGEKEPVSLLFSPAKANGAPRRQCSPPAARMCRNTRRANHLGASPTGIRRRGISAQKATQLQKVNVVTANRNQKHAAGRSARTTVTYP